MKIKLWSGLIALFLSTLLLRAAPAMAEAGFQPGLWEIQIRTELAGVPSNQATPVASRQCIRDESEVPRFLQKDHSCRVTETKTEGDRVSWKMKCEAGEATMDGGGRITYRGSRFDGAIGLTMRRQDAGPLKIRQHVSGRRLGECP